MMKRILILVFAALLVSAAAYAQTFTATLSGANEVGGGATSGAGLAVVTFNGTQVTYTILVSGFDAPTIAHIHTGAAGTNGSILLDFAPSFVAGTAAGTVNTTAAIASSILANPAGFYVNVHSTQFPNGAVRGQLAGATTNAGTRIAYLPAVGKTAGANNTNFVTDVRIVNDSGATANVTFDYFESSADGRTAPSITKSVTVAAGEEKVLNDFVGVTLGVTTNQLGGIKVTSDRNVLVTARIINDLRSTNQGTTGLAIPAIEEAGTSGVLPFLSESTDFRSNLGYFNPSSTPVTATLTARRASDGAILGTNTRTIPGFSMLLGNAFDFVPSVTDRNQNDFYVTWSATGPVFIFGSVVDNKTGDSLYVD